MKYLLYGVFRNCDRPWPKTLRGVGRQAVFLIEKSGLSAAVSKIEDSELTADVSGALAYEKVLGSIHRTGTVIPMRFGSTFENKSQIAGFLEENRKHYAELLTELEGSTEMGVRILLQDVAPQRRSAQRSGAGYLAAQSRRYAQLDGIAAEQERISREIHRLLSGLFAKSKSEPSLVEGCRQLSLHFLISRNSVTPFRRAFRQVAPCPPAKLFLSGPWPLHNFVS
jgi:gas vesicle protein GvpL/GvpF